MTHVTHELIDALMVAGEDYLLEVANLLYRGGDGHVPDTAAASTAARTRLIEAVEVFYAASKGPRR